MIARIPEIPWNCAAIMVLTLAGAGVTQNFVERRRLEANLTWADPQDKEALEIGFMALGGFRGLLADVLWFKAQTQQDSAQYYNLKLMCELIQKLQPTFTQVHAFQGHNMAYNLAEKAETGEDKWFWIVSGISTLEKGLERTRQNYRIWFELGWIYFDRLGDKLAECRSIRDRELPRIDDLSDEQIDGVFSRPRTWTPGHARPNENYRFAAYYFWQSWKTNTELDWTGSQNSILTERIYGECLEHLGMWFTAKPVNEWKKWSDGGAEPWYVDVRRRNPRDATAQQLLRWLMYEEIVKYNTDGNKQGAEDAYGRFKLYFPGDTMTIADIIKTWNEQEEKVKRRGN